MERLKMSQKQSIEQSTSLEDFVELIKPLPAGGKVELLQMFNGIRPVAQVTVIPLMRTRMVPVIQALEKLGFGTRVEGSDTTVSQYYVSKDPVLAEETIALLKTDNHRRFGELMGFPPSAIEAYVEGESARLTFEEVDELIGFENYCFPLRFSRTHPEDAISYLRTGYKMLLEQAPEVLAEMLPLNIDRDEYMNKVKNFVRPLA